MYHGALPQAKQPTPAVLPLPQSATGSPPVSAAGTSRHGTGRRSRDAAFNSAFPARRPGGASQNLKITQAVPNRGGFSLAVWQYMPGGVYYVCASRGFGGALRRFYISVCKHTSKPQTPGVEPPSPSCLLLRLLSRLCCHAMPFSLHPGIAQAPRSSPRLRPLRASQPMQPALPVHQPSGQRDTTWQNLPPSSTPMIAPA